MPSNMVTTAEAAMMLNLTTQGVRNLAERGVLAYVDRVGPRQAYIFDRETVEALAVERAA